MSSIETKQPAPLMYMCDYYDIIFFIKHFKYPSNHFDGISQYVTLSHSNTRSTSHNKLHHKYSANKLSYFVTPTLVDYQEVGMS